jgi:hypothetical protein
MAASVALVNILLFILNQHPSYRRVFAAMFRQSRRYAC